MLRFIKQVLAAPGNVINPGLCRRYYDIYCLQCLARATILIADYGRTAVGGVLDCFALRAP
jgi:hypothetical protein